MQNKCPPPTTEASPDHPAGAQAAYSERVGDLQLVFLTSQRWQGWGITGRGSMDLSGCCHGTGGMESGPLKLNILGSVWQQTEVTGYIYPSWPIATQVVPSGIATVVPGCLGCP